MEEGGGVGVEVAAGVSAGEEGAGGGGGGVAAGGAGVGVAAGGVAGEEGAAAGVSAVVVVSVFTSTAAGDDTPAYKGKLPPLAAEEVKVRAISPAVKTSRPPTLAHLATSTEASVPLLRGPGPEGGGAASKVLRVFAWYPQKRSPPPPAVVNFRLETPSPAFCTPTLTETIGEGIGRVSEEEVFPQSCGFWAGFEGEVEIPRPTTVEVAGSRKQVRVPLSGAAEAEVLRERPDEFFFQG